MLRPILLLPVFLLAAPVATPAQDLNGKWTNGWMEFTGGKINDSLWAFNGADLHEGGYRFAMKPSTDSSWLLKGFNMPATGTSLSPRNYRLISPLSPGTSPSKEQARRNSANWRS